MSGVETIGLDLGGSKLLLGVIDGEGELRYSSRESSPGETQAEVLEGLERELRAAIDACPSARAAGLGIPCTIDRSRGVAIAAVNVPLRDVAIRELMSERLGLPVFIDNDANMAALAEHRFGAARGTENAVMLTIGTGIGGGLIIAGELYRGSRGAGAELGHVVIEADGPPCQGNCPGRGCVESLASGTALAREARGAASRAPESGLGRAMARGEAIDGELIAELASEGDAVAAGVFELIGRRLGVALASLANTFEPQVIVLGGGVMAAGELILSPAQEEMRSRALSPMDSTPVVAAELGPEAGMIGAAEMARIELEAAA